MLAKCHEETYRGIGRECDVYRNADVGFLGKIDHNTEEAWNNYMDLLGDAEPIVYSEDTIKIMSHIVCLNSRTKLDMEVLMYTDDLNESPGVDALFLGYDVAGTYFSSVFGTESVYKIPGIYTEKYLNKYGLFDDIKHAVNLCDHVNKLRDGSVEPEFPYRPIKVYAVVLDLS